MGGFELNPAQRVAAEALEGPVLIAAGAGSGKTRVLAERSINAVVPGRVQGWTPIPVERLLAITFTDKAAGELAERIRTGLAEAGEDEMAQRVDGAWITTIHGMCSRILRADALDAGIDPSFAIADGVEGGRAQEAAFEEAAQSALERGGEDAGLFAEYHYDELSSSVRRLERVLAITGLSAEDLAVEEPSDPRDLCIDVLNRYRAVAESAPTCDASDKSRATLAAHCSSLAQAAQALLDDELLAQERLVGLWRLLLDYGKVPYRKDLAGPREEVAEFVATTMRRIVASVTAPSAAAMIRLTSDYADRFEEAKRRAGLLDFDDLQTETRRFLESDASVSGRWAQRFDLTMLDEFQDTDALQLRIVNLIADDDLCTVGDELQSIYRFRGADIDVYRHHNDVMVAKGATRVSLRKNYRSHPGILVFVNEVFRAPFSGALVELEADRAEPDPPILSSEERVRVFVSPKQGSSAAPCRDALAERIARHVLELHDVDGIPLNDVVILLRAYTHAEEYASALRAVGLDAVVVGGDRFLDLPEVGVLRALCRVLSNRRDETALGVVLASPLCGLSDHGLLAARRVGAERLSREGSGAEQISEADLVRLRILMSALDRASESFGSRPIGEVVLRVVESTGWDLRLLASGVPGEQAYASILKFARMADGFEATGGYGPAAFEEYLMAKERLGDHEAPASVSGEGAGAVRLMSIHQSKGLEFPVVIVPELESGPQTDTGVARWSLSDEPRLTIKLPASWPQKSSDRIRESPWMQAMKDQSKAAEAEEYLRLFYVAFTRARELLVLAGVPGKQPGSDVLSLVLGTLGVDPVQSTTVERDGLRVAVEVIEADECPEPVSDPGTGPTPATADEMSQWETLLAAEPPSRNLSSAPSELSYSGLKAYEQCPRRFHAQYVLRMVDRAEGSVADATGFGSAVHAVLQAVGSASDPDTIATLCRYHRLDSDETARLHGAITAFLESDIARQVEEWSGPISREAPFAIWIGEPGAGFCLHGSMDLYARGGERSLLVDYKTGTSGEEAELAERYELQARCYALAALRDGARRVDVVFVRPEVRSTDGAMQRVLFEFTAEDGAEIERDLLRRYLAMAAGGFEPRESRDEIACRRCPVSVTCPS